MTSSSNADAVVLVVDDDRSMRDTLQSLIRSVGLRCETFATGEEFLAHGRPDHGPACLVLDVMLARGSGLDLPAELERADIEIPIVFITGHGTIPMSVRAMKAGAVEFLTKPFSATELLDAVREALERDRAALVARAAERALSARFATLTPRERDVFRGVAAGRLNKQIAAELGMAEQTVKQHRGRMMEKLELRSVADLVRFAERLDPPLVASPDGRSDEHFAPPA